MQDTGQRGAPRTNRGSPSPLARCLPTCRGSGTPLPWISTLLCSHHEGRAAPGGVAPRWCGVSVFKPHPAKLGFCAFPKKCLHGHTTFTPDAKQNLPSARLRHGGLPWGPTSHPRRLGRRLDVAVAAGGPAGRARTDHPPGLLKAKPRCARISKAHRCLKAHFSITLRACPCFRPDGLTRLGRRAILRVPAQ